MGLLNFFKSKSKPASENTKNVSDADNVGTLHLTISAVNAYWIARTAGQKFEPFLLYQFDNVDNAITALLQNSFIHRGQEITLVCTEAFEFGAYKAENGKYEAFIAGWDFNIEQWDKAKEYFEKYGGKLLKEQKPEKQTKKKATSIDISSVVYQTTDYNGPNTYEIFSGPNAETAKEFLKTKTVTESLYYIVVETPEGNYGKDKGGIYKE